MGSKGIAGFELLIMGVILTFGILIAGILPTSSVKLNLDKETIFEYKYNKVQHTLLSLFSITHDEKKVSELIAENFAINKPSTLDFLKSKLDKLIEGKCYEISNSNDVILLVLSEDCKEIKYRVNSTLVLPYNPTQPLTQEIKVGIG